MKDFTEKCTACKGNGGDAFGPCTDCYGQGEIPDHAAKLAAFEKREELVQEVIAAHKACSDLASKWASTDVGIQDRQRAGLRLKEALDKLAEWSPE